MPYMAIQNEDGHGNGGIAGWPPGTPPHWLVYFGTDDIDATMREASELGGTQIVAPMDIGVGKIAVAQDPQGAVLRTLFGSFRGLRESPGAGVRPRGSRHTDEHG